MPYADGTLVGAGKRVLPSGARAAGKQALRWYGVATSPARRLPDYLIIGAKRCGTTSLQSYLLGHPDVAPMFPTAAHVKGAHYFDRNAYRSLSWYRSFFPVRRPGRPVVCGEASPYYLIHPRAAARAARVVPAAKIIVLLRDPVERALSHYRDEVRNGFETRPLARALAEEPQRLEPELARLAADERYYSFVHEHLCYLTWGRYADHLGRWLAEFPREQLLALPSAELFARPALTYQRVVDFLGLRPDPRTDFPTWNATSRADGDSHVQAHVQADVRAELRAYYRPYDEQLRALLPAAHGWTWGAAPR